MKKLQTKRPKVYFVQLFAWLVMFAIIDQSISELLIKDNRLWVTIIIGGISGLISYLLLLVFLKIFKKENYLIKKY